MQGYRALTREDLAARIVVQPLGPQLFSATVHIPGRAETSYYELAGDALYVDAHILKWHPMANVFGLHTAYELDRIAGRYDDLERERAARRTVHSLSPDRWVDLFDLRTRYAVLAPLSSTPSTAPARSCGSPSPASFTSSCRRPACSFGSGPAVP